MCGTPNYLAPEVVMDGVRLKGYDHQVDSWSVGVIVFSMYVSFFSFYTGRALMYTSGRLTNTGPFIEDDEDPDIARRISGRTINWSILHQLRISTAGT